MIKIRWTEIRSVSLNPSSECVNIITTFYWYTHTHTHTVHPQWRQQISRDYKQTSRINPVCSHSTFHSSAQGNYSVFDESPWPYHTLTGSRLSHQNLLYVVILFCFFKQIVDLN